jgi:hypothetical protein
MIDLVELFVLPEVDDDLLDKSDKILPFEFRFRSINEVLVGVDIDDEDPADDDAAELTNRDDCLVISAF